MQPGRQPGVQSNFNAVPAPPPSSASNSSNEQFSRTTSGLSCAYSAACQPAILNS
jgi:hypothetical protein